MAWPDDRPVTYDGDKVWDKDTETWTSDMAELSTVGGERFRPKVIVVSDQGQIYFGD